MKPIPPPSYARPATFGGRAALGGRAAFARRASLGIPIALAFLTALVACGPSAAKPPAAGASNAKRDTSRSTAPEAFPVAPTGSPSWLPTSRNGEEGTIEGVPLISVEGTALLVDGLRIGDLSAALAEAKTARIDVLFTALRARRDAWLTTHPGKEWPGVVAYRFGAETPASIVKSVVITAGYAACPNGSLLVEVRAEGKKQVGRLPIDPLMVTAPEEKVFVVDVHEDSFTLAWKESARDARTKQLTRKKEALPDPVELPALAAEITTFWEAAGIHRLPVDPRVDQAILRVDNAVPYALLVAVVDALNAPRRSMKLGVREERVAALNINLAP